MKLINYSHSPKQLLDFQFIIFPTFVKKINIMKKLILILFMLPTIVLAQCWQFVDAGANHTLAIRNDGTIWSWGSNNFGKLGYSTATGTNPNPYRVGISNNWQSVSAGEWHSSGIKSDGTLWVWGYNAYGQGGQGTSGTAYAIIGSPTQVGANNNWQSVSVGTNYTLAIKSDGTLWGMGTNEHGELGIGSTTFSSLPIQIGTSSNWKQVSANNGYSIGIKTDGTLWQWGNTVTNTPTQFGTDVDWDKIANSGTFGIKTNGTLWAWGYNQFGQLGDDTTIDRINPVQIGTNTNWQKIYNHYNHTIATRTDNTLWSWGDNEYGQLGDATLIDKIIPLQIGAEANWTTISNGEFFSIAIKSDGTLFSWGVNYDGRLGNSTTIDVNIPTQVSCSPLSIENFSDNSFIVYPNPAKGFITIKKNDNLLIDKFIVIDINGKVVIDEKNLDDKLNIEQLPNGVYLLQINCQNKTFNYKFIKE
jgi:alpha-tubulin suppressor-like RCC1 family protein